MMSLSFLQVWMLIGLLTQPGAGTPVQTGSSSPIQAVSTVSDPDIDKLLADSAGAYKANDTPRGRKLADSALALAVERGLPGYEAEALLRIGRDEAMWRRHAAAREKFERSRQLFLEVGNRARAARAAYFLGVSRDVLGDNDGAIEILLRGREEALALGADGDVSETLVLLGERLMFVMEASEKKARLREEILAEIEALKTSPETVCNIHQEWGDELFIAGRYAEAYAKLTATVQCFEKTTDVGRLGRALVSLGRVERAHGQLERALDNYVRALILQERINDVPALAQSLNAMAVTLNMLGRNEEALACVEEAVARARVFGDPVMLNTLIGTQGNLLVASGRFEEALPLLTTSRANERNGMMKTSRAIDLAHAYLGLGKLAEAYVLANEAVALSAENGPETRLRARGTRASVAAASGRFEEASNDQAEVLRIIEDLRAHTLPSDLMRRGFGEWVRWYYGNSIDLLIARKEGRGALEVSEQGRSRAFLDRLASREAADTPAVESSSSASASTAVAAPATAVATSRPGDAWRLMRTGTPSSLADIQSLAARLQSTWLTFWVGDTATIVWVVTPQGAVHWARVPIRATQLEALVARSVPRSTGLDALASLSLGSRAHLRPWRELYRLLVRPVAAYLPTTPGSRLTIVPHGPLFRVSFAALQDEAGRYLLERYDLHYVPAAGVLQFTSAMNARHGHAESLAASHALLVGDPGAVIVRADLSSTAEGPRPPNATLMATARIGGDGDAGGAALPSLDWARQEVSSVAKLLPGPHDMLIGREATETAVRQRLAGRRVIHFATHGVVQNEPSLSSYLVVRGNPGGGDSHADGRLTADEINDLTLDADLVVLSACGTALGPISGDGVQGFTRAFLSAGAGSVVATTWSIADRTSYQVMDDFYRAWLNGRSKSRALRQAQLSMLRRLRAGTLKMDGVVLPESPWLWAGFVLVGNP